MRIERSVTSISWIPSDSIPRGLTPVTVGPLRVMLPTKANRDIRWQVLPVYRPL
jgi:hypothetical protein